MHEQFKEIVNLLQEKKIPLIAQCKDLIDMLEKNPDIKTTNAIILIDKLGYQILRNSRYKEIFDHVETLRERDQGYMGTILGMKVYRGDDGYKPNNPINLYGPMPE